MLLSPKQPVLISLLDTVGDQGPVELSTESVKLSLKKTFSQAQPQDLAVFSARSANYLAMRTKSRTKAKCFLLQSAAALNQYLHQICICLSSACCTESPQQLTRDRQSCLALLLLCNGFRCLVVAYPKTIPNTHSASQLVFEHHQIETASPRAKMVQLFMLGTSCTHIK